MCGSGVDEVADPVEVTLGDRLSVRNHHNLFGQPFDLVEDVRAHESGDDRSR